MSDEGQTWAAGWYNDPERVGTLRYYNGQTWEDKYAPTAAQQPVAVAPEPEENNNSIIVVGLVLAVLLPIVGLIIGLTQINKRNGILVVIVSVLAFATWFMILQEQFGGTDPVPYTY